MIPSAYIPDQIQEDDPVFGSATSIPFQPRNTTRDWGKFLPRYELQAGSKFDTLACVSFAKTQDIEGQCEWLKYSGNISAQSWQDLAALGFISDDGKFEASSRFLAIVSKTTNGNTFNNVANAVQQYGILSEKDMPSEPGDMTRDEYYKWPTSDQLAKAKKSLDILKFDWQYVNTKDIEKALQMAPVQIATAVCPGWGSDDPIKTCSLPVQHSTLVYDIDDLTRYYQILDHYVPFLKDLAPNYYIYSAMQTVVSPVTPATPSPVHYLFTRDMVYGERSQDVFHLQQRLNCPLTGIYDEATRIKVFTYQLVSLNLSVYGEAVRNLYGRRVGPATRAALNK